MKNILIALAFGLTLPALTLGVEDDATLPLPPYTCVGRIVDYEQLNVAVIDENATISVYANDGDTTTPVQGALLAQCKVSLIQGSPYNYRLVIPMATIPSETAASPGSLLIVKVICAGVEYDTSGILTAPAPAALNVHDIALINDQTNPNGIDDSYETDTITRAVVRGILPEGTTYDPNDDYDGDGVNNATEYFAGTDPLSSADTFGIVDMQPAEDNDNQVALEFLVARAKSYQLKSADNLDEKVEDWETTNFRETDSRDIPIAVYHTTDEIPDPITKTIYIPKKKDAEGNPIPSRFFSIGVE